MNNLHPVYLQLQKFKCNGTKKDLAFQLYMVLCEEAKYFNVDFEYCVQLDLIVVTGSKNNIDYHSIIAVNDSDYISPEWLTSLTDIFANPVLGVLNSDGTCVLLEINQGICKTITEKRTRSIDPINLVNDLIPYLNK